MKKSTVAIATMMLTGIGVIVAVIALIVMSAGDDGGAESQSSLEIDGDIRSQSESGDSTSESSSQGGEASATSSSTAQSGDSTAESSSGDSQSKSSSQSGDVSGQSSSEGGDASVQNENNSNQNVIVNVSSGNETKNGGDEQEKVSPVSDDEPSGEQDQSDPSSQTLPPVALTVVDGEQVFRPGTGEVYVVKIVEDERYKRHFLTPEIRDSYGQLIGVEPTHISQEEFDSFAVSCLVNFGETYYFLDVHEGDDEATKHLITGGWSGLDEAGVSATKIFEVHDLEIDDSAFVPGADISAATAARKPCGGS